jgi:hypothetical protein
MDGGHSHGIGNFLMGQVPEIIGVIGFLKTINGLI